MTRAVPLVLALLVSCALPAAAQEEPPPQPEVDTAERLRELESWIILEEEDTPEPPLLRFEVGADAFFEVRSRIQADRGLMPGTRLDDLEKEQGLLSGGGGPWLELTLGGKVRGGVDFSWFARLGDYERQTQRVVFDGVVLAEPGDLVKTSFYELVNLGGFAEWNMLYGKTYRIGLTGGVRYFRFDVEMRGVRPVDGDLALLEREVRGELLSPFFGGQIELTPFPYLSVHTSAQFMNWSWKAVNLKDARYFRFRLGTTVNVIPGLLGVGVEYRFLNLRAVGRESNHGERLEGSLTANGLNFYIRFSF